MESITREIIKLFVDEKKGICYFGFEDKVYKVPIEKCHNLKTEIERKIKKLHNEWQASFFRGRRIEKL